MVSKDDLIEIGYIKRPHGFKGGIQIVLNKEIALNKGDFIFVLLDGQYIPYPIDSISSSDQPVMTLGFVDSFEKAEDIAGHGLYIIASESEQEDLEWIGMTLMDEQLGEIGKITDVVNYPQQQMLVLDYNGNDVLIPLVEAFFQGIEFDKRIIYCNLPDGILDQ